MHVFRMYAHLGVSIQHFFMRYPRIGGWKHTAAYGIYGIYLLVKKLPVVPTTLQFSSVYI